MNHNKATKSFFTLCILFAVFCAAVFGVQKLTAPLAEKNALAAQLTPLYEVLPGTTGFEKLWAAGDEASELSNVPETVKAIYKSENESGFAASLSTTAGFTGEAMEIALGIGTDGKITGASLITYPDTKDFGADYPASFIGQDSALSGAELVSGATYSSSAFKNAISDAMLALVDNGLISAGYKPDWQILTELLMSEYPGMTNPSGIAEFETAEAAEGSFEYITHEMKPLNQDGYACIAAADGKAYLVMFNSSMCCRVFDTAGNDVTAGANEAMVKEAEEKAAEYIADNASKDAKKIKKLADVEAEDVTQIPLEGVYSSVSNAFRVNKGGSEMFGFAVRSYGYSNQALVSYWLVDENGKIAAMTAPEFILMGEYYTAYELDEDAYKAGFEGISEATYTGNEILISGATVTSDAIGSALKDVFSAYNTLK